MHEKLYNNTPANLGFQVGFGSLTAEVGFHDRELNEGLTMSKRKYDNFPAFFGGRIPLSKKEKSIVGFGFLFGMIGAILSVVTFGDSHKLISFFMIAAFILFGSIIGAKVSSMK